MPAVYEREPEAVRGHPLRRRKKEEPSGEHLGCNSIDILSRGGEDNLKIYLR